MVLKNWNSPVVNIVHGSIVVLDSMIGLFNLYRHQYIPALGMFGVVGLVVCANIMLGFAARRRARAEAELTAALERLRQAREVRRNMSNASEVNAKAMANLEKVVKAVGGQLVTVGIGHPLIPPVIEMNYQGHTCVVLELGDCLYIVLAGNIYKFRGGALARGTCYHGPHGEPYADNMASALLLLKANPGVFEKWCRQDDFYLD